MQFLDLTLPTPEENLALDEALLVAAEADGDAEYLRVWESPTYFVVLGKNCRVEDDVFVENCRADGVPFLRRISGGGTVLLGPGCLNYSIVLRFARSAVLDSVPSSFAYCLDRIRLAIADCGITALAEGTDLTWEGRKFGGNAQRRQSSHFLHHGTILYGLNRGSVSRYLKEPVRQPAHRLGRDHAAFLTCVPVDPLLFSRRVYGAWQCVGSLGAAPLYFAAKLVNDRYARREWNFCRSRGAF